MTPGVLSPVRFPGRRNGSYLGSRRGHPIVTQYPESTQESSGTFLGSNTYWTRIRAMKNVKLAFRKGHHNTNISYITVGAVPGFPSKGAKSKTGVGSQTYYSTT